MNTNQSIYQITIKILTNISQRNQSSVHFDRVAAEIKKDQSFNF